MTEYERPGGLQIRRFCVKPERPVVGSAEDEPEAGDAALLPISSSQTFCKSSRREKGS